MPNIFAAGADEFAQDMARREAMRLLEQDRARRDRMDEEARSDRERSFGLQERQLSSLDQDRDERRELSQNAATVAQREREERAKLMDAYDRAKTPEERRSIGLRLINSGGKVMDEVKPIEVSPGASLYDQELGKNVFTAPNKPTAPGASSKDDPKLPRGTKAWIDSIAARGVPLQQARQELSQGWGQQRAAHPAADLAMAARYLNTIYPDGQPMAAQPDPIAGRAAGPAPAAQPEAPVTIPPSSLDPNGIDPASLAGNAPGAPNATPKADAETQAAIAKLVEKGRKVTPEAIEVAKRLIREGK